MVGGVDYVDDSKATNPHAASASLRESMRPSCGSRADCSRAPTSTRWSPRSPPGWRGSCCWVATGRIAASLARHAPMVPVVTVVSGDDDRVDTSAEATMSEIVAAAAGWRGQVTPSSWRRRPRPWTCSATTRTVAGRSPTPSGRWDDRGHARTVGHPRRRGRAGRAGGATSGRRAGSRGPRGSTAR